MDIELQGRTAKAHIDKWQHYGKKAGEHATSAALILIAAKEELPHGAYIPWLEKNGIAHATAKRLVLEHKHPEKAEERRAENRDRERTVRSKKPTCEPFEKGEPKPGDPLTVNDPRAPLATAPDPDLLGDMTFHWMECLKAFEGATPAQRTQFKRYVIRHSKDLIKFMS